MARRRHMSMLRSYTWADLLTIANASCGTIAIFLCLDYLATDNARFLWTAFILLPAALVCDVLDGYVARLDKKRQSVLGADLDSLADVISFGVAPAVLGFTLGLRGGWDMLILTYFVVCGVSRLARFNVTSSALQDETTGKVKYLRRHADPDQRVARDHPWHRPVPRPRRRWRVVRRDEDWPGGTAPARADVLRQRQRDDQRDAADTETIKGVLRS